MAIRDVNTSGENRQAPEDSDITQIKDSNTHLVCEHNQPHLPESYAPYLTPEATPTHPAALLATAIRCSGNQEEEAEDQLLNTQDKPFSGKSCSMSTKYGN